MRKLLLLPYLLALVLMVGLLAFLWLVLNACHLVARASDSVNEWIGSLVVAMPDSCWFSGGPFHKPRPGGSDGRALVHVGDRICWVDPPREIAALQAVERERLASVRSADAVSLLRRWRASVHGLGSWPLIETEAFLATEPTALATEQTA